MEAMVNLATVGVGKDQIARWLSETAGPHEAAVRAATAHLEAARTVPKFALCLLVLSAGRFVLHRCQCLPPLQLLTINSAHELLFSTHNLNNETFRRWR